MPPALVAAAAAAMAWLPANTASGPTPLRPLPPALPLEKPAAAWPCILDESGTAAGVITSGFWSLQAEGWHGCLRPLQSGKDPSASDYSYDLSPLQSTACLLLW